MNARTWITVLVVALAIAAAPLLQSLIGPPTPEMFQAARAAAERSVRNTALAVAVSATVAAIEARDHLAGNELAAAAAMVGLLCAGGVALFAIRRRRDDEAIRRRVRQWARRGRSTAWISRESGLAQDAVRFVVGPISPPAEASTGESRRDRSRR